MNQTELFDAMLRLYAYDTGSIDSGIKDELLKARVKSQLKAIPEDEFRLRISRLICYCFVDEHSLKKGYGFKDVISFFQWMNDQGIYDISIG
jgi:hypothetical protein